MDTSSPTCTALGTFLDTCAPFAVQPAHLDRARRENRSLLGVAAVLAQASPRAFPRTHHSIEGWVLSHTAPDSHHDALVRARHVQTAERAWAQFVAACDAAAPGLAHFALALTVITFVTGHAWSLHIGDFKLESPTQDGFLVQVKGLVDAAATRLPPDGRFFGTELADCIAHARAAGTTNATTAAATPE